MIGDISHFFVTWALFKFVILYSFMQILYHVLLFHIFFFVSFLPNLKRCYFVSFLLIRSFNFDNCLLVSRMSFATPRASSTSHERDMTYLPQSWGGHGFESLDLLRIRLCNQGQLFTSFTTHRSWGSTWRVSREDFS